MSKRSKASEWAISGRAGQQLYSWSSVSPISRPLLQAQWKRQRLGRHGRLIARPTDGKLLKLWPLRNKFEDGNALRSAEASRGKFAERPVIRRHSLGGQRAASSLGRENEAVCLARGAEGGTRRKSLRRAGAIGQSPSVTPGLGSGESPSLGPPS